MGASYRPNPGNGGNHLWMARYANPEEHRLFSDAVNSGTDAEAAANFGAWAKLINDELPIGLIYFKAQGYAVNPRLTGYAPVSMEWFPNVETWYFK
jgi:hypothetical protein